MIYLLIPFLLFLLTSVSSAQDTQDAARKRLVKEMEYSMEICKLALETKTRFMGARQGLLQKTKDISRGMHVLFTNPEFKDDQEYGTWLTQREGCLERMRIMIKTENYEDTVVAFNKVKDTCTKCHEKFR
jgi:cytochrome c556